MKKIGVLLAAIAGIGMSGMFEDVKLKDHHKPQPLPPEPQKDPPVTTRIPDKLIHSGLPDNHMPAKGCKMEKVCIEIAFKNIDVHEVNVSVTVNVCYSNAKTRAKALNKIQKEIIAYVQQVPLKELYKRNEMAIGIIS